MNNPEEVARIICTLKDEDPDFYFHEYDRDAAAEATLWGNNDKEVFRKVYAWEAHLDEACLVINVIRELSGEDDE